MKFAIAALLFTAVSASSLKFASRLNQAAADNAFDFLGGYALNVISCEAGEAYTNPASGVTETSSVIFRLCPSSSECSDDVGKSCKTGYGDYIIGLNTFAQEYLLLHRDGMLDDDEDFTVEQLGECSQYYADENYYVNLACAPDSATGIRVALFTDANCTNISEAYLAEFSVGCESCYTVNDAGEAGLNELCVNSYDLAGKCETKMETFHSSGMSEAACNVITALLPKNKRSGGGKVIGWLFLVLVIGGLVSFAFTAMKKKKKEGDERFGLMS